MEPRWLVKQVLQLYVGALFSIVLRHGLSIGVRHKNQPSKCKLALYKLSIHFNSSLNQLYISSKIEHFSYKGEAMWCDVYRGIQRKS